MATTFPAKQPDISWRALLQHHLAAWGAVLCALVPLLQRWSIPVAGHEWPVRIWPGHLLIDAMEFVTVTIAGLAAGGWWWWAAAWRRGWTGAAGSLAWPAAGVAALTGMVGPAAFLCIVLALLLWAIVFACFDKRTRPQKLREWMKEHRPWNLVFFILFVLLNTTGDVLMTGTPPGWLNLTELVAARFLTQLVLAASLWLLLWLGSRWWPRGASWAGWTAIAFAPLLVALDIALRLAWTKSLPRLCAEIEFDGRVDWLKIREGLGGGISGLQLALLGAAALSTPVLFLLCRVLSRRGGWRTSAARLAALALTGWVALMAVQLLASFTRTPAWRRWESRAGMLELTPFTPAPGLVSFRAVAADPRLPARAGPARRPDIFFFIVETMRNDSIAPERTPFLARWREEECQVITEARAASNSTHLSWFAMLHGRLPWFEEAARPVAGNAPLLALLRDAGWRIEVRSAGNFDYSDMTTCHFGGGIDVMEHIPLTDPDWGPAKKPENERRMMERLRRSVAQSPPGAVFRLTAIDTAHYPYLWHKAWTPPYAEFEKEAFFPLVPSEQEITLVRHRYWNSIAWGDHLIGEFVAFLKASGRYESSLIIVTGDHGEEFKEHGSWVHCSALNPEQTRVPLLIKWPAESGRGPALSDASHLDILPSILDAAGFPPDTWEGMPGRSLLRVPAATSIVNSCYNSQNREAMVWRREGWEAAFSWPAPWTIAPPATLWLDRLEGPDGPVDCADPAAWEAELRRRFPDAFARVFARCERVGNE